MRLNFAAASLRKVGGCGGFHGDAKADALAVECHLWEDSQLNSAYRSGGSAVEASTSFSLLLAVYICNFKIDRERISLIFYHIMDDSFFEVYLSNSGIEMLLMTFCLLSRPSLRKCVTSSIMFI